MTIKEAFKEFWQAARVLADQPTEGVDHEVL